MTTLIKKIKPVLPLLIKSAVTATAFWLVLRMVDLSELLRTLRAVNPAWLAAAVAAFFAAQAACIIRWKILLNSGKPVSWAFAARAFFVASFFNLFLPTTIGGDFVRVYDTVKETGDWRHSLASILIDRLFGLAGFLLFAGGAWLLFPAARADALIQTGLLVLAILLVSALAVLNSRRALNLLLKPFDKIGLGQIEAHSKQFQETIFSYRKQPKILAQALTATTFVQIGAVLIYWSVCNAFRLEVPLVFLFVTVPVIIASAQIPVSINGWGVREATTVLFLSRAGVDPHEALSVSLICGLIPLLGGFVGAILFLLKKKKKRPTA